jgi:hypothetical protein
MRLRNKVGIVTGGGVGEGMRRPVDGGGTA